MRSDGKSEGEGARSAASDDSNRTVEEGDWKRCSGNAVLAAAAARARGNAGQQQRQHQHQHEQQWAGQGSRQGRAARVGNGQQWTSSGRAEREGMAGGSERMGREKRWEEEAHLSKRTPFWPH